MTQPASSPALPERPSRPAELEDWLNARLYHPLSARLARALVPTRITPDMVSATGALAIMLAAAAYGLLAWPWGVMLGLVLHMSWHVLDGADGDLARLRGRASPHGELVDGICDYLGHIVLYATMAAIAAGQIGGWGWVLACGAGVSRAAQAAHYEGARRQYQLVVYGTPWLASRAPALAGQHNPFVAYYLWITGWIVPHGAALRAAAADPARREGLREAMRARAYEWLGLISPLSANYRTLGIGLAMLAGKPQWYFLFEMLVLGGVLLTSLARVRRAFGAALAQAAPASTRR